MNQDSNAQDVPEIVSISQMARLLHLGRSRFYQLVNQGIFLAPKYLDNKRPYYTAQMAARNLAVKRNNTGINGKVVIFYTARDRPNQVVFRQRTAETASTDSTGKHAELIEGLKCLGMENVTGAQVDTAIKDGFPDGTDQVESGEILRKVFLSINRQNTEHKPRT